MFFVSTLFSERFIIFDCDKMRTKMPVYNIDQDVAEQLLLLNVGSIETPISMNSLIGYIVVGDHKKAVHATQVWLAALRKYVIENFPPKIAPIENEIEGNTHSTRTVFVKRKLEAMFEKPLEVNGRLFPDLFYCAIYYRMFEWAYMFKWVAFSNPAVDCLTRLYEVYITQQNVQYLGLSFLCEMTPEQFLHHVRETGEAATNCLLIAKYMTPEYRLASMNAPDQNYNVHLEEEERQKKAKKEAFWKKEAKELDQSKLHEELGKKRKTTE